MMGDGGFEELLDRTPTGWGGLFYGAYPGIVTDVNDPEGLGRVKVRIPWVNDPSDGEYLAWARLATMMAGNNRGSWFIPDVEDEVLVVFMGGDTRQPVVVGAMWNGQDTPPHRMDGAGRNYVKKLRSRNGVQITLDDTDGQEKMVLETPGGQRMTLKDGPGAVEIVDSNGNSLKLEAAGITITASAKITINAGAMVEVSASMVKVSAGMSQFSGVVQCDTLITNSVVSASYTPGAGNVW